MCDGFLNKKKVRVVTPSVHITTLKGNARTLLNLRLLTEVLTILELLL
jgi:hypothetical protein